MEQKYKIILSNLLKKKISHKEFIYAIKLVAAIKHECILYSDCPEHIKIKYNLPLYTCAIGIVKIEQNQIVEAYHCQDSYVINPSYILRFSLLIDVISKINSVKHGIICNHEIENITDYEIERINLNEEFKKYREVSFSDIDYLQKKVETLKSIIEAAKTVSTSESEMLKLVEENTKLKSENTSLRGECRNLNKINLTLTKKIIEFDEIGAIGIQTNGFKIFITKTEIETHFKKPHGRNSKIEHLIILNNVERIGKRFMMDNYYLKSVVIPSNVKVIHQKAFFRCNKLTEINKHPSTQICNFAFKHI